MSVMNAYNPKSHAPSVYIPAWLLQVSSEHLSLSAKVLYGRLAQWANTKSCVHRSTNQLAEEMGVSQRVIKRFLAELREVGLIETYQAKRGGENYYKFLDHPWIHDDLLPVFDWRKTNDAPRDENVTTPVTKTSLPRDENVTPKVKEIKISKKELKSSCSSGDEPPGFKEFYDLHPRNKKRLVAKKIWIKKNLEKIKDEIISKMKEQILNDKNWKDGYIPLPDTYLNQERWKDAIEVEKVKQKPQNSVATALSFLKEVYDENN